ncbi:hypothetical protein RJT34_14219 [Clitoria ternatea]|uniref:Uncharacterized protein n=1 Tax=Clitoria ternatea TaxID=43366 RepID=A0AAN9JSM4_CLITE
MLCHGQLHYNVGGTLENMRVLGSEGTLGVSLSLGVQMTWACTLMPNSLWLAARVLVILSCLGHEDWIYDDGDGLCMDDRLSKRHHMRDKMPLILEDLLV